MNTPIYLVAGLGKTGYSLARYLSRRHEAFALFDTRISPPGLSEFRAEFPEVEVFLADLPTQLYGRIKAVLNSPGVSLEEPFIQQALERKIPVYGDIECLSREIQTPLIAITGTNGKSTVTTLVGEMAKASGLTVAVAGNIGLPVLDILDIGVPYDLWVLELSSFQLELTDSFMPTVAVVLNISPDHLDRHHTFEAYVHSKHRVYQQTKQLLYNRQDPKTRPEPMPECVERVMSFGLDAPRAGQWGLRTTDEVTYLAQGDHCLMPVTELKIKGRHNWLNALAACALADSIGIETACMIEVLRRFSGLPHRCQWIRTIDGVDWINDSKGTNVGATVSAIMGIGEDLSGQITLIAGGEGKDADFRALRASTAAFVRTVILIGKDADQIEAALEGCAAVLRASSLKDAIELARLESKPNDVVLMSPACASFDMFRDFNHRGDDFIALVEAL